MGQITLDYHREGTPNRGMLPKFNLGQAPVGEGLSSKVFAIKGSRKSCFVNQLHWAPSKFEVGGHFSLLTALELRACQLSQLNPITASSISFGPMEHSLITSPKFSIIPTKAPLWPHPEEFSLGAAGGWGVGVGLSGASSSPSAGRQDPSASEVSGWERSSRTQRGRSQPGADHDLGHPEGRK